MKLLNGLEVAEFVKERQLRQARNLRQTWKVTPRLAIVQTVENPVIDTYVRLKRRYADDIEVETDLHAPSQDELRGVLAELNARDDVHGIIVQLPLADMREVDDILPLVAPAKDVDGLGGSGEFVPATALAIDWLLAAYGVELGGRSVAIVGHGRLVGAPLATLWRAAGYQVTVYDETDELGPALRTHDVLVTATGVPRLITSEMVQIGAIVVDAGTASEGGTLVGDVADEVRMRDDVTITPVRGGVGPLTIAALMDNVLLAARRTTGAAD